MSEKTENSVVIEQDALTQDTPAIPEKKPAQKAKSKKPAAPKKEVAPLTIHTDRSPSVMRGKALESFNALVTMIMEGAIVVKGLDLSLAEALQKTEYEQAKKQMTKALAGDNPVEIADAVLRLASLNSKQGDAKRQLIENYVMSYPFKSWYETTPTTPTTNGGVDTNKVNTMRKLTLYKQCRDELKAYLTKKQQGNSSVFIANNSWQLAETWALAGASNFTTSDGFQFVARDSQGKWTVLESLGSHSSASKVCEYVRQKLLNNHTNAGVHTTEFDSQWASNVNYNSEQYHDEFMNQFAKKGKAKK